MKIRQYVITEPKMEQPPIINDVVYIYINQNAIQMNSTHTIGQPNGYITTSYQNLVLNSIFHIIKVTLY